MGTPLAVDTVIVLFFLSLELGRSPELFAIDTLLMSVTTLMVVVLPYFLLSEDEMPSLSSWVSGRLMITFAGLVAGVVFRISVGTVLPEAVKFLPMTLLIITAMISCYIRLYSLMKLRLVK